MKMFHSPVTSFCRLLLALAFATAPLLAVQPAPPPPDDQAPDDPPWEGNLDLSTVPIPDADLRAVESQLTEEELKGPVVDIAIVPVGAFPPPIIYLDETGMPREQERDPLEYAPSLYHIKTSRGEIKLFTAQNQIPAFTTIPRGDNITIEYEVTRTRGEQERTRRYELGTIRIPPQSTHILVFVHKDPSDPMWNEISMRPVDVSPGRVSRDQAVVANFTGRDLYFQRAEGMANVRNAFVGPVPLTTNDNGRSVLAVRTGETQDDHDLVQTYVDLQEDERTILVAWAVPRDEARPHGIALTFISRRMEVPASFRNQGEAAPQ